MIIMIIMIIFTSLHINIWITREMREMKMGWPVRRTYVGTIGAQAARSIYGGTNSVSWVLAGGVGCVRTSNVLHDVHAM